MLGANFKTKVILVVCFVAFNLFQISHACSRDGSKSITEVLRPIPFESTAPEKLVFYAGDIISCGISLVFSHILLASSNSTGIHAAELGRVGASTVILEQNFPETSREMFTDCEVLSDWSEERVKPSCPSGQKYTLWSPEESIRLARNSLQMYRNLDTPYNLFSSVKE